MPVGVREYPSERACDAPRHECRSHGGEQHQEEGQDGKAYEQDEMDRPAGRGLHYDRGHPARHGSGYPSRCHERVAPRLACENRIGDVAGQEERLGGALQRRFGRTTCDLLRHLRRQKRDPGPPLAFQIVTQEKGQHERHEGSCGGGTEGQAEQHLDSHCVGAGGSPHPSARPPPPALLHFRKSMSPSMNSLLPCTAAEAAWSGSQSIVSILSRMLE